MKTKEEINAYQRKYTKEHPGFRAAVVRKWEIKNPFKKKAHMKVTAALKAGTLLKKPCKVCKNKRVDAHHQNYAYPLKVVWLCRLHHKAVHKHESHRTK